MASQAIAKQLIRASTSIAKIIARPFVENRAQTSSQRWGIVEEECDETLYWTDGIVELGLVPRNRTADLQREAGEILAVVNSSIKTARRNIKT